MPMTRLQRCLMAAVLIAAGPASAHAGSLLPGGSALSALSGSRLLAMINVPEPGTWVLMGSALLVIFGLSRRKVQKTAQLSRQREVGLGRDIE
jgi:hypothetical protein